MSYRHICLIVGLTHAFVSAAARGDEQPVAFAVSPTQTSYHYGPRIFEDGTVAFTAKLTNISSKPISVDTTFEGNITLQLTCNGKKVSPRRVPYERQASAAPDVRVLRPGESVSFMIAGIYSFPNDGQMHELVFAPVVGKCRVRFFFQVPVPKQRPAVGVPSNDVTLNISAN